MEFVIQFSVVEFTILNSKWSLYIENPICLALKKTKINYMALNKEATNNNWKILNNIVINNL